jgi:hypothetical protein
MLFGEAFEFFAANAEAGAAQSYIEFGANALRNHQWGHLPYDKVTEAIGDHRTMSQTLQAQLGPHWGQMRSFDPATANQVHAAIVNHRRANRFLNHVVDAKIQSLAKKPSVVNQPEKLAFLKEVKAGLHTELLGALDRTNELARHHAVPSESGWRQRAANGMNAARGLAYRRPILVGTLMIAGLAALPILALVGMIQSARSASTQTQ